MFIARTPIIRLSSSILFALTMMLTTAPLHGQSIGDLEYLGPADEAWEDSHKVMPGESLYSIARQYGLTVEKLQQLNQMDNETIYPGQRLIVKEEAGTHQRTRGIQEQTTPILPPMSGYADMERRRYYQVRQGERIEDIAARFQIHPDRLREWNAISNVYPGQTLIVDKWVERVNVAELRGREASANLRTSRGMDDPQTRSRSFDMEPVGNLDVFAQGPFAAANTRAQQTNTRSFEQPYEQVQDGEWLMERPSYRAYRQGGATQGNQRTYQRAPERVFDAREVSGPYDVVEDRYRGETTPFYAFHNDLPAGTKVEVQIPNNSGFIELEIVGPMPRGTRGMIALSPSAARIVQGAGGLDQRVTIRY